MLHPSQFEVNEAWILFQLNENAIRTTQDGDFDLIAFMDAASCFILASAPVAAARSEPTQSEWRRMLLEAHAHKQQWPKTLFVPTRQTAHALSAEAERQGIEVIRVAEDQLLAIIGEARASFMAHFGSADDN